MEVKSLKSTKIYFHAVLRIILSRGQGLGWFLSAVICVLYSWFTCVQIMYIWLVSRRDGALSGKFHRWKQKIVTGLHGLP